ncbi:MAG: hypothetical protein GEU90_12470 [Gemmatimonas sp.]|nr:hypothetical protein [Gemmatimonas sp.]
MPLPPRHTTLTSQARPPPGSDDIGDVSWVVPTVTLRFPANIPGATFRRFYSLSKGRLVCVTHRLFSR